MCALLGELSRPKSHNATDFHQADGRDSETNMMSNPFRISREVFVPQIENGSLHYIVMDIVAASDTDSGWAIKESPSLRQTFPTATGPSAVTIQAIDGIDSHRIPVGGVKAH